MNKLKIKEVFRYGRPYDASSSEIDGFRNHFFVTDYSDSNLLLLEKGISPVGIVNAKDGKRTPAILIRSSPHKIGSETTPWHDVFDTDNGHIRYYGDNKHPGKRAGLAPGNKVLLQAFIQQESVEKEQRKESIPLIFYKAVSRNSKAKGFLEFHGFGIITGVELITQYDRKLDRTFSNYAFNFQVFSLAADGEEFNWQWINDRRNAALSLDETFANAPKSWIDWINNGKKALERSRRRVSKLLVTSKAEQLPEKRSREEKTLQEIYQHYHGRKSMFEAVASKITAKIFSDHGNSYREGWITPSSSDGGADFYGRLDVGTGFGKAKIVVLGQAKCESINIPTNGNHIARTVARLRRGWIGVYVTTSFFSEAVQREIIEDEYPIMLINGKKLAETVLRILYDEGYPNLKSFLQEIDSQHERLVQNRNAKELLIE